MPEKPLAILYNSCVYELKSKTTEKRWKNVGGWREREGKMVRSGYGWGRGHVEGCEKGYLK